MKKILILVTTALVSVVGMMLPGNVVKAASGNATNMTIENGRYYFNSSNAYQGEGQLTSVDIGDLYGRDILDFDVYIDDEGYLIKLKYDERGNETIYNITWFDSETIYFGDYYNDDISSSWINDSGYQPSQNMRFFIQEKKSISRPGISGSDSIINNIDNPYSLEDIKRIADIQAIDDYYGDISHLIQVKTDGYSANSKKVGVFKITYKVTNEYGLSAEYVLNIINQDSTSPAVNGPDVLNFSYTKLFTEAEVLAKYTATDNYDTAPQLKLNSDEYTEGSDKVGSYNFFVTATDSSGNSTRKDIIINIIDDIAPVISDFTQGKVVVNFKGDFSDAKAKSNLQAIDAVDGDITNNIKVVDNPLKAELGTYIVKYEVTDKAGNTSTHERTYEVITEDIPEFWVSKNLINIEDVNKLSIDQIARIVATYENIDYTEYTILENDYIGNETTPGEYLVKLALTDTLGNVTQHEYTLAVFDGETLKDESVSFWTKTKQFFNSVWNVINSIGNFVWKVVTAPFKWLGKLLGFGKTKSVVVINRFRL